LIVQVSQVRAFVLSIACLLFAQVSLAQILDVQLKGIEGELRDNALAWLGEAPQTPQARANYLYSAETRLQQSLQALGYYRADIELDLTRGREQWTLVITVDPGDPVQVRKFDVRVLGEASTDEAFLALLDDPGIAPGDVFNHGDYERFRRRLAALAQQRGYFDGHFAQRGAAVEPIGGTVDIALHFDSGQRYAFGALQFDQDIIREELLQPLFNATEGEPFDQQRLRETQAQLQRTGYFSTVILVPELDQAEAGVVPLDLRLYPAKRHSFDLGVGFSTDTRERVSVTWRTPKLNRLGHSQETRLQYSSINPSGRFTYSIPMSHPLNDILQLSARLEDNEFGDLDSHQKELALRREIRRDAWIYSYSLRGLNESWNTSGLRRENDYLLPGFSLSQRRRTGSLVNPDAGFSQWYRVEAGHSDIGSDIDLVRLSANYGYIYSFTEKHRVVLRSDLGAALVSDGDRDELAPSLNFFAGGSQSIRGFSYQSIGNEITVEDKNGEERTLVVGGERLATASAEYQYSFTPSWRGAVFLDGGDAFDEGEFDLNYGAGFGVHYVTQVGAIRLEFANPLSKDNPSWRMHLAIGAEF
jgi:translocation and assembly module TamA